MCEVNVYLTHKGGEELILEDAELLKVEGEEVYLRSILGEEKRVKARLKEVNMVNHRIILQGKT